MKAINKIAAILLIIVQILVFTGVIIFALATFIGKSYLQTFLLLTLAIAVVWWPGWFKQRWNKAIALTSRFSYIILILVLNSVFFSPGPKTSIYLSEELHKELMNIYDKQVLNWPDNTEDIYISTEYGRVHVLACGSQNNPPLMMIHAASMGAHSWAENLEPLLDHYRIYSIDNIGEGNKSQLINAIIYPGSAEEIADLYAVIADSLKISSCPVFGASNGGFVAMSYARFYPERVEYLALFGPMGLTKLSNKSFMMLSIATMYPFQFIRNGVHKWAFGEDEYIKKAYGDWFNCILKGTMPSVAKPVPLATSEKQQMDLPVLLFLGTKDKIVGDAEYARKTAQDFPNIHIEVLESGHLVAVEKAGYVNKVLSEFLKINK